MHLKIGNERVFAYTGAQPHQQAFQSVVFVHGTGMDHTEWLLPAPFFDNHEKTHINI